MTLIESKRKKNFEKRAKNILISCFLSLLEIQTGKIVTLIETKT